MPDIGIDWLARDTSCVVLGNAHNPSILNHDWLEKHEPQVAKWGLQQTIVTPGFAQLHYDNNLVITLEFNKLTITCASGSSRPSSVARDLCRRYVQLLPHVPYTAVGINFSGAIRCPGARAALIEKLLTDGPWKPPALHSLRIKLAAADLNRVGIKNLEIGAAERNEQTQLGVRPVEVMQFAANYHQDTQGTEAVLEAMERFESDLEDHERDVKQMMAEFL